MPRTPFKTLPALLLALALPLAQAGGDHQPKHGGIVVPTAHMDWELVAKPERITLHASDHGKKASTAGATGKLLVLSGKDKTEAVLKPAGDDRLEAEGPFTLGPGTKIVATVQLAGKPVANVRFSLK
ncbi:hypothetical protein [Inhella proteolytica]|uniref:Copper resistance protein CopC n=1 Tax=Inhella proteolytica TaxID=2795029 RepID=A0A931J1F5_9BURK|nr:hypothetical protein [Inhella proteolytica]MBH9576581.1 hypothetical protein [Inhella proteolytica]